MDVYEALEFYKKYDPLRLWGFKGVNAYELLADDWHVINRGMNIKEFFGAVFPKRATIEAKGKGDIAFFYNPKMDNNEWARAHYSNFINAANTCNQRTVLTFSGKFKCSLYSFLCYFSFVIWFFQCNKIGLSIKQRLAFIACLFGIKNDVNCALRYCRNKSLVVVYSDVYDNGYYLIHVLKCHGIKTATMMHGYYTKDDFNMTMSHSDYFFADCDVAREHAIEVGYPRSNVFCVGISSEIGIEGKAYGTQNGTFAVILDAGNVRESLTREKSLFMITSAERICEKYGYRYILRYHPGEIKRDLHSETKYMSELSDASEDIQELLARVDFVILGSTSVILSAISQLIPFYRCTYNDDHYYDYIVNRYKDMYDYDFADIPTLMDLVNTPRTEKDAITVRESVFGEENIVQAHISAWEKIRRILDEE